ncbi:SDR family oxidoreductase [Myxococcota bacterium]|nr:SDR family oxidoreductase [Myxococcota bacterium]
METLMGLEGKGALVVGAGQGIGRAVSHHLTRCGAKLALVDLDADRLATVVGEVSELGGSAEPIVADVTQPGEVAGLVETAVAALGRLDALINIVGMAGWSPLLEMDEALWDGDHTLNLKQHFFVCQAVARQMVSQGSGGTIATVASVSGLFGAPKHGAYGAAKAGVVALTRTMSQEWAQYGIRVNTVAPGSVLTPRIQAMRDAGEIPVPEGDDVDRIAEPVDIAGALLFLSSDLARRVNGHTLVVDGGTTAMFPFDME